MQAFENESYGLCHQSSGKLDTKAIAPHPEATYPYIAHQNNAQHAPAVDK